MSVENLNLDNAQKETTVTNMELDKKGEPKVTTEELVVAAADLIRQPIKTGELLPGQAAEGDHDGRDGDPELVNFLMDDKDKYIRVEIRADMVDRNPVIKNDGKHLIWARFLRPGWGLLNRIRGKTTIITPNGLLVDESKFNEDILKYLLKEWNFPVQLIFGIDSDNIEILSNIDTVISSSGVHPTLLSELIARIKEYIV